MLPDQIVFRHECHVNSKRFEVGTVCANSTLPERWVTEALAAGFVDVYMAPEAVPEAKVAFQQTTPGGQASDEPEADSTHDEATH